MWLSVGGEQKYFDEISQDTGKYCFGVDETLKALDAGAVETLIVWDNLETMRWERRTHPSVSTIVSCSLGEVCAGQRESGPCYWAA